MEYVIGTPIYASDGEKIGKVDRIVVQGALGPVHAIVAHKGFFLQRDLLIPVSHVAKVDEDGVYLDLEGCDADTLHDFVEQEYAEPPAGDVLPTGFPMGTIMYPMGVDPAIMPLLIDEKKRLQVGEHDLSRGLTVRCADGEVGVIKDSMVDDDTDRLEAIIVQADDDELGEFRIPAGSIEGIDDDIVTLRATRDQLRAGLQPQ